MKKKLIISFSGGRTSAFMLWWMLNHWEDRHDYEIVVVFANTGKESEGTLFFIDECANEWGIEIVWVEAKCKDENGTPFSKKGWTVKHKVVTYETASRNGEPFEEMISVLGIPSTNASFCSDQLKRKAIESYLKSIGWKKKDYIKAIGYRIDEPHRFTTKTGKRKKRKNVILPLVDIFPVDKNYILNHFRNQNSFDLDIHPDDGNCDNCWKKNRNLLVRNAQRKPKSFNWWQKMIDTYGHLNPRKSELKPPFNFYRGNMSANDILSLSGMSQAEVRSLYNDEVLDGCSESCEAFKI